MDEANPRIFIDGAEVPVDKYRFSTPRHLHWPLVPEGRARQGFASVSSFEISFCAPADVLRPYLDGEFHDVIVRPDGAGRTGLAARIRLRKHDEENGTWYGHGCVTDENHQVITWKELANG
jgi:hypothetical protein